jgi:hypothetical protein
MPQHYNTRLSSNPRKIHNTHPMKKRLQILLCALCGLWLAGQALAKSKYDGPAGKPYVYKTSAGKERQMEIFFPPNHDPTKTKVPGVILFHGGGWQGGALDQFRAACVLGPDSAEALRKLPGIRELKIRTMQESPAGTRCQHPPEPLNP